MSYKKQMINESEDADEYNEIVEKESSSSDDENDLDSELSQEDHENNMPEDGQETPLLQTENEIIEPHLGENKLDKINEIIQESTEKTNLISLEIVLLE